MSAKGIARRQILMQGTAVVASAFGMLPVSRVASTAADDRHVPQEKIRLHVQKFINAVAWNADGSRLATLGYYGSTVTIWNTKSWTVAKEFVRYGGSYSGNSFIFLPDGSLLTTAPVGASPDPRYKTLAIFSLIQWDPETGQPIRYIPDLGYLPRDVAPDLRSMGTFAVSADGSLIAGISRRDVLLYDTQSWSLQQRLVMPPTAKYGDFAEALAFSPDGRQLAVGTLTGIIHFFNLPDGSIRLSFPAYEAFVGFGCAALAFSPDGRLLATGKGGVGRYEANNGWTRLWQVEDGMMVARLADGEGSVRTASWSPDGSILAMGDDKLLLLWRVDQLPQAPRLIEKVAEAVTHSVAFSRQGQLAVAHGNTITIYQ